MEERISVFYDPKILYHNTGTGFFEAEASPFLEIKENHPENADRILNFLSVLKQGPISKFVDWGEGITPSISDLERFHEKEYINKLIKLSNRPKSRLTSTTVLHEGSFNSIKTSAGLALAAAKNVWLNKSKISYALCRPPGHHAQPSMADGYCFINNIGVAIEALREEGLNKAVVIDWDVHHGNGTQEGYYNDKNILTISIHMDHGAWGLSHPQTGKANELGLGEGYKKNLNIPLPCGSGNISYLKVFDEIISPAVKKHAPEIIFIACGQDASQFDPNGRQLVDMKGFYMLGQRANQLAKETSNGKLVLIQEGGYAISYASYCLHSTLEGALNRKQELKDPIAFIPEQVDFIDQIVEKIKKEHDGSN